MSKSKIPNAWSFIGDDLAQLVITRRNDDCHVFVLNADLVPILAQRRWHISLPANCHHQLSVVSGRKSADTYILLNRLIAETSDDQECRFVDGDHYNYRRGNLANGFHHHTMKLSPRILTNGIPESGQANVVWSKSARKWRVGLRRNRVYYHVGFFHEMHEAIGARDTWLQQYKAKTRG